MAGLDGPEVPQRSVAPFGLKSGTPWTSPVSKLQPGHNQAQEIAQRPPTTKQFPTLDISSAEGRKGASIGHSVRL